MNRLKSSDKYTFLKTVNHRLLLNQCRRILLTSVPRITPCICRFFKDSIVDNARWWSALTPRSCLSHRDLCATKTSNRRFNLSHTIVSSLTACWRALIESKLNSLKLEHRHSNRYMFASNTWNNVLFNNIKVLYLKRDCSIFGSINFSYVSTVLWSGLPDLSWL